MSNKEEIYLKVVSVLEELFEADPEKISNDAHLYQDLDLDSIDAVVGFNLESYSFTGQSLHENLHGVIRLEARNNIFIN